MNRRLIFRVDANPTIGRGHLSRCIAIAAMLNATNEILFVALKTNKVYMSNLLGDNNACYIENKNDFFKILKTTDVVWIDGYEFTEIWKKEIRCNVYKLIETNDIPYKAENVDLLFNHTIGIQKADFKDTKASLYLGLDYVLLRQKFLKIAKERRQISTGNGVFVCFGGADTYNLGYKFVKELVKSDFKDKIYWVTNNFANEFNKNVVQLSNLNEDEMISYMNKAKILLIPSSVLSFEAMSLRKPIFTCYFVDNQNIIYNSLCSEKLAQGVGVLNNNSCIKRLIPLVKRYYDDVTLQAKQVKKQVELLDGFSTDRIQKVIGSL